MISSRGYRVTLTGQRPLLLHNDNLEWADQLKAWRLEPDNKKKSVAGDDRSPAWTWIGSLYHYAGVVGIPADNLMTTIREGGVLVPTGKGQKTFKAQSQSGILVDELSWPLETPKGQVSFDAIKPLMEETDFSKHQARVLDLGFELFPKRARVGQAKHVRVRPRFNSWSCSGTLMVIDDQITTKILESILENAGRFKGLGDWRPGAPKSPGPYGMFTATVEEIG